MFPLKVSAHVDFPKTRTTKNSWFGVVGDADKRSVMSIAYGWWAPAGVVQEEQLWMSIL